MNPRKRYRNGSAASTKDMTARALLLVAAQGIIRIASRQKDRFHLSCCFIQTLKLLGARVLAIAVL